MKRDMGLIRDLMLRIEGGEVTLNLMTQEIADALGIEGTFDISGKDAMKLGYHLDLLQDTGFVVFGHQKNPTTA